MKAYKGFNKDLSCYGGLLPFIPKPFQYEIGKTYEHDGKIEMCSSGFHACTMLKDVLEYYPAVFCHTNTDFRYCIVECDGEIKKSNKDSKICCNRITILRELSKKEMFSIIQKETEGDSDYNSKTIHKMLYGKIIFNLVSKLFDVCESIENKFLLLKYNILCKIYKNFDKHYKLINHEQFGRHK